MKDRPLNCRCSTCRYNCRSSWWRTVLKERAIRKEIRNATSEG